MSALLCAGAFFFQALAVQAGNSRCFGLFELNTGWYTNMEMSDRYPSLVTPAGWAFAIWGIIYIWEFALVTYLLLDHFIGYTSRTAMVWDADATWWWVAANVLQATWAFLFAREMLAASSFALSGICICLFALGATLHEATFLNYGILAAPAWLHAGWTAAAAIVNWNLLLANRSTASIQLFAASATAYAALGIGCVSLFVFGGRALPLSLALAWALIAIRSRLDNAQEPFAMAYAEIGEVAREAISLTFGCNSIALIIVSAFVFVYTILPNSWNMSRDCYRGQR